MSDIFKIRIDATCPSHARSELTARQHEIVIDEPPRRGGTDLGPTPLETMLASFLGCTNVIANLLAEEMAIPIDGLALSLTGHLDRRSIFDEAGLAVPFPTIELNVDITTAAPEAEIDRLKAALAKRCPVSRILREAGSEIIETWNVERP